MHYPEQRILLASNSDSNVPPCGQGRIVQVRHKFGLIRRHHRQWFADDDRILGIYGNRFAFSVIRDYESNSRLAQFSFIRYVDFAQIYTRVPYPYSWPMRCSIFDPHQFDRSLFRLYLLRDSAERPQCYPRSQSSHNAQRPSTPSRGRYRIPFIPRIVASLSCLGAGGWQAWRGGRDRRWNTWLLNLCGCGLMILGFAALMLQW